MFENDPTGIMSYRKVLESGPRLKHSLEIVPEGKSIVTLTVTENSPFHGVDVIGRVEGGEKCIKHFNPEIAVLPEFTIRRPIVSGEGYGSLDYNRSNYEPLAKIFLHPKRVMVVDTFLTEEGLGSTPKWSRPVIFSWDGGIEKKFDRPYQGTLKGGP